MQGARGGVMSVLRRQLRLAVKLSDLWSRPPEEAAIAQRDWQRMVAAWQVVEEARRRALIASRKGFAGALESCRAQFRRGCADLVRGASAGVPVSADPVRPESRQLLAELRQIESDFEYFEIEWKDRRVSAYTPVVVLKDLDLGRFRIDLYWEKANAESPPDAFEVVADEPSFAAGNREVCHPHVRANRVCLGDGAHALKTAMREGRLADAFHVVASVLQTYNPGSAYVHLEDWNGEACDDCGGVSSPDDIRQCEECESNRCGDCVTYCDFCSRAYCYDCIGACADCHESVCSGCSETTQGEDDSCCPRCARKRRENAEEEEVDSCTDDSA